VDFYFRVKARQNKTRFRNGIFHKAAISDFFSGLSGTFYPEHDVILKYAYYYSYDSKGRLSTRKTPGRAIEYFIYDKLNRLFLYQNGNLRGINKWQYNKYDALGRTIITGVGSCGAGLSLAELQTSVENLPFVNEFLSAVDPMLNIGYTNNVMPELETSGEIQSVNYYDTYHILQKTGNKMYYKYVYGDDPDLKFVDPGNASLSYYADTVNMTGKATCTRTLLVENGTNKWLFTVYYYDKYGRVIQIREKNHRSGYDVTSMHYKGLTSDVDYTKHQQTATLGTNNYNHTEENTNTYDHAGRLTQNRYKINYSPIERTFDFSYNTLGQLIQKNIKNSTYLLQSVDYKYTIRGLLKAINDAGLADGENDLFGMEIYYDQAEGQLPNIPRHNGTISAIKFQSAGGGIKGYKYEYDALGRLKRGIYAEKSAPGWSFPNKFSENDITYDLNGNIKTLVRTGLKNPNNIPGNIDDVDYFYNGNQLIGVNDAVTTNNSIDFYDNGFNSPPDPLNPATWEYTYDNNGNLTSDKNKGIVSITYNYLNQPVSIDMGGGKRITYLYDRAGRRLQKTDYINSLPVTTTDYISNFVYNKNVISYAQTAEGRIVFATPLTVYSESYITDHLGNVRATFRSNATGQVQLLQVNNYYPYGLRINASGAEITFPNEYMYQGKELDNENGLNWYNFHARMYDPVLGRWHTPDPAQQYVSPYMAMGNDPVNRVDPNGMWDGDPIDPCTGFKRRGINWDLIGYHLSNFFSFSRGGNGGNGWQAELYNGFTFLGGSSASLGAYNSRGGGGGGGSRNPVTPESKQYSNNGGNGAVTPIKEEDIPQSRPNPYRTVVRGNEGGKNVAAGQGGDFQNVNNPFSPWTSWAGVIGQAGELSADAKRVYAVRDAARMASIDAQGAKIVGNIGKVGTTVGWVGEGISISVSVYNLYNNPTAGNWGRFGVSVGIAGTNFFPYAGPLISFGLSAVDAGGGFNGFYDWLDE